MKILCNLKLEISENQFISHKTIPGVSSTIDLANIDQSKIKPLNVDLENLDLN